LMAQADVPMGDQAAGQAEASGKAERAAKRHVVARAADIPVGDRKVVTVRGREIVVFNVGGEFHGLINRCPHQGARLSFGTVVSRLVAPEPGKYQLTRTGEMIRCPWHCWEFDIKTGQSLCDPNSVQARAFDVKVEPGKTLVEGPFVAESVDVSVEDEYIVVTM
jgi:nitrite reductase/ring-hydroxylating ferredoxin subunit